MKLTRKLLALYLTCVWSVAFSQPKKALPTHAAKPNTSTTKGPLSSEDYQYYFLVSRGGAAMPNAMYKLADRQPSSGNLNFPFIVIDSRTMKELAWWPDIKVDYKQGALYAYTPDRQGNQLAKFTPDGKLIFSRYLVWKTPTGEQAEVSKSSDDKQVFAIYNNDAWVGDFDLSNASVTNMHQITQLGDVQSNSSSYMRNNLLLLNNYMVNTQDGSFSKAYPHNEILSDTTQFFTMAKPFERGANTIWMLSFSGWKQYRAFGLMARNGNQEEPLHWLDRGQSKVLWNRTNSNGQTTKFVRKYSTQGSSKDTEVTWSQFVATRDNEMWGPLLELAVSPTSKYLVTPGSIPGTNKSVLYVYNLETFEEYNLPINMGTYPPDETAWADDTHLVFTMRSDRMNQAMLDEQNRVTVDNQGTYILDINTKQIKRLTPYLLKDYDKNFIRLSGAKTIVFQANNYLFKSNSDGSGLVQLTQIPNAYTLQGTFLK